jgi:hypothetical protein
VVYRQEFGTERKTARRSKSQLSTIVNSTSKSRMEWGATLRTFTLVGVAPVVRPGCRTRVAPNAVVGRRDGW